MLELLQGLEDSGFGAIARESLYGFQILVGVHLLGLTLSVGVLLWVDLRMLGVCLTAHPLAYVYRRLASWFSVGFVAMALSGIALFAGFATDAYENSFFRIKIIAIALAGINAIAFHTLLGRTPVAADVTGGSPPIFVRVAGGTSIVLWAVVILCGRMLSYTLF